MNKTAVKNFAIWARNKLIADISYRAGLMGITADGIHPALPQSTGQTKFYDIGTAEPYAISGEAIRQREHLADLIRRKAKDSNYQTAYKYIIEEVAYTWFNRLIAVRFMEVNDYLPSHIRVLSSDQGKIEPDLVTTPFDADLDFTRDEQQTIMNLKSENKLDELFRLLFIKQCNALNEILPALFEKTNDYSELLLSLSVIDQDGVVYHLVHDILEEDFDVDCGGQVEIIGWLYQYYNTEPKNAAFAKKGKITKEEIPAVTQLFTPDWIVRYMVENSLGRLWVEHLIACGDSRTEAEIAADFGWKYYLPEAEQEPEVAAQLAKIREERKSLKPEEIRCIDPCMGSGHICVYLFSVLMQIYESAGYGQRDATRSILENNLYGLDIDDRAFQMAYFAVMMKAREYNRRILNGENKTNLYSIQESNGIDRRQLQLLGKTMAKSERAAALKDMNELLDTFVDAKEYGSILTVKTYNWERLLRLAKDYESEGQISFESVGLEETSAALVQIIEQGRCLAQKYDVTATNPPYMSAAGMGYLLAQHVKINYTISKSDLFAVFIECCKKLTAHSGYIAMITMQSWMFLSGYEQLRAMLLKNTVIYNLLHLGIKAFEDIGNDIVQTCSFVLSTKYIIDYKGCYFRLLSHDRSQKIKDYLNRNNRYITCQNEFFHIPGNPIAYWSSKAYIKAFEKGKTLGELGTTRKGMYTGMNERFVRNWYEVNDKNIALHSSREESRLSAIKWYPYANGGDYRKWYGNWVDVVNWQFDGAVLRNERNEKGSIRAGCFNLDYIFTTGITWTSITSSRNSMRIMSGNSLFSSASNAWFGPNTLSVLAFLNSKVAAEFLHIICPSINANPGDIAKLPFLFAGDDCKLENLVNENIDICRAEWDSFETSWGFKRHPLILDSDKYPNTIRQMFSKRETTCEHWFNTLKKNEEEINHLFIQSYELHDSLSAEIDEHDITVKRPLLTGEIKSLLSYTVGCIFGRYSLDVEGLAYAGGEWDSGKYTSFIPDVDNIIPITDEEYLEDDIISRLCEWLKVVYGKETLEENLDFIAKALGNKGGSSREIIRNYFLTDFFKDHCQTYSVTGSGKRPTYWLFDSGKQNGFKALIYLHRYNADTVGNLRIDYLHRMQRIYESEIVRMQDMIDNSTNNREVAQATKRREKLTKQLKECREYDEKLAHLALSRIELDLDDGVKVNYRKLQTANDGRFYEVLADSKNIMAKK